MKKSSVFIALALVVLCLVGWIGVGSQMAGETSMYDTYVQQADDWVEKGLYQRAISRYNLALEEQENQELYGKMISKEKEIVRITYMEEEINR